MTAIRPLALAKQLAAIPFHFVQHQWKGVAVRKSEKHAYGPHPRQYLMFWMPPKGVPEQNSVVIFYHGGGWRFGWPNQFPTVAAWFLRRGFPVILPAYRLCPQFSYREMREDLNLAFLKSMDILQSKGWSSRKLLAAGMSAGATLAAHLAFNRNELIDLGATSEQFSGFLSFGGPLDLNKLPDVKQLRDFAGGPSGSDAFVAANPISWLTDSEPLPILLLHGTKDAIVPFSSSESFYEKYSGQKELYPILNGSHLDSLGFALNDHTAAVVDHWLHEL